MACAPFSKPSKQTGNEGTGDDAALIERLDELRTPAKHASGEKRPTISPRRRPAVEKNSTTQVQTEAPAVAPQENTSPAAVLESAPLAALVTEAPTPAQVSAAAPAPEAADTAKPRMTIAGTAAESTLRVDVALLNRMMNLVGELVLTRNQVLQATAADPNMTLLSRRLDMVTADLRESVMKARMQPVSNIFSKMPRIVRDLSQSLGRRVSLHMEGQDTELDKSLLEAIKDPLTHAVRNSLDHGIEPPEVRQASGKAFPELGR